MNLIRLAIQRPVGVSVAVILIVLFGAISLGRTPIQLTPDVDKPSVTVETRWPGASALEVEREIVDRQEDMLKSVDGLVKMTSESQDSTGKIILEFPVGVDIDSALLKVSNKLEQVKNLPDLADKPVVTNVDARSNAMTWIILKPGPDCDAPIETFRDLAEDIIKPRLERVPGVASSNVFGGWEREVRVTLDLQALALRNLSIAQVADALATEHINVSAGDFDEGKRRYVVRTVAEFDSPADLENIVLHRDAAGQVRLGDVASVAPTHKDPTVSVRHFGEASIAVNCQRETGANVLEAMAGVREAIEELNAGVLAERDLYLRMAYDETDYITAALDLVRSNLIAGGLLAVAILWLFLRSGSSVLVVAVAIPISVVGTFIFFPLLDRNINVVTLAGMSFAVGMVVDNSIVVLENIYRHLQMGKTRFTAAFDGAREVWGAVLASTLTTMAVFLPILYIQDEAGQLFRDIAIAISCAVGLSLVISITVIPTMAAGFLRRGAEAPADSRLTQTAQRTVALIGATVTWILSRPSRTWGTVIVMTGISLFGSWVLTPPAEYLPTGNRNLAFGILLPPPGYNLETLTDVGRHVEDNIHGHFLHTEDSEAASPAIRNFFFVAQGRSAFLGAIAENPDEVHQLIPTLRRPLTEVPGMIAIITQASLFSREIGTGRSIEIELTGPDLQPLLGLGLTTFLESMRLFPGAQVRPKPSLDLGNPEVHVRPRRADMARLGLDARSLGIAVDTLLDGRKVNDFRLDGDEVDITLSGDLPRTLHGQDLGDVRLVHGGRLLPLGSLADIRIDNGPEQVNHVERQRAVTISVVPPDDLPLETAMARITDEILKPLEEQGRLGGRYQAHLSGTADDLVRTRDALFWNFILALVITYLLMSALFSSYLHPLVIMFSVPLASVGGFLGLRLVNLLVTAQPLDILTMLGFVILVGTVVNNAILIVHYGLQLIREDGLSVAEAMSTAVRIRVRPIFMSTMTSVFGMLPLVIMPGAGSELYRGIGSVVVGGLICSTLFTLLLIPAVFSIVWDVRQRVMNAWQRRTGDPA